MVKLGNQTLFVLDPFFTVFLGNKVHFAVCIESKPQTEVLTFLQKELFWFHGSLKFTSLLFVYLLSAK